MDGNNNVLALGLYLAIILAIVGVAYLGFTYYEPSNPLDRYATSTVNETPVIAKKPGLSMARRAAAARNVAGGGQRAELAEQLLNQRTDELQRLRSELVERERLYLELKEQHEETVSMAADWVGRALARDVESVSETPVAPPNVRPGDAARDPETLRSELDQIQVELGQAYLDLAELRERSDRELLQMVRDELTLRATVADVLKRLGEPAVAPLIASLRSEDAETRRAAAVMLGDLEPTDTNVISALRTASSDSNDAVRDAAERALRRIQAPR